jgi:hypothetical protein
MDAKYDINTYTDHEIMSLFSVSSINSLTQDVIKNAKKKCLMLHPDKTGLDGKMFIFYINAYKRLKEMYIYHHREKYLMSRDIKEYRNSIKDDTVVFKKVEDANAFMKEYFDKVRIDKDDGYGDWLKQDCSGVSGIKNIHDYIMNKKKEMAVSREISVYSYGVGSTITGEGSYESDIFAKLKYDDVRKAHTETIIPMSEYRERSIHELEAERGQVEDAKLYKERQEAEIARQRVIEREEFMKTQKYLEWERKKIRENMVKLGLPLLGD